MEDLSILFHSAVYLFAGRCRELCSAFGSSAVRCLWRGLVCGPSADCYDGPALVAQAGMCLLHAVLFGGFSSHWVRSSAIYSAALKRKNFLYYATIFLAAFPAYRPHLPVTGYSFATRGAFFVSMFFTIPHPHF